jgi:methionyl-tRNA formyltransferase
MKVQASPVKALAEARGLPVLQPTSLKSAEARSEVFRYPADAMVVAAYGLILPQPVLDFPRLGCINIHASLLPRWRGAAPIQRALLAGDERTGVSIMQMDAGLDTGPVLREASLVIAPDETAGTLHDRLAELGAAEVVAVLAQLRDGFPVTAHAQAAEGVTYAHKVEPAEAKIDWGAPAEVVERQVRAFNPFPGAWTSLGDTTAKIWRTEKIEAAGIPGTILEAGSHGIVVACGSGALRVLELQRAGGKRLPAAAFLAGHRLVAGTGLSSHA